MKAKKGTAAWAPQNPTTRVMSASVLWHNLSQISPEIRLFESHRKENIKEGFLGL